VTPVLTHVRLLVRDFRSCYRFYRDVLGMNATFGTEDDGYADFAAGPVGAEADGVALALFDAAEMAAALGTPMVPVAGDRTCLVLRVDDVDRAAAEVTARGAVLVAPPTDHAEWGIRTAHLRDPDGNLVELHHDLTS
jgi:lactoylglutathione lyase